MTVQPVSAPPATNGTRRPVLVTVPRADLVERLCDLEALAHEGMEAVGDALTAIERLYEALQGTSPRIKAIEYAVADIYDRQVRLLNEATVLAGIYDKPPNGA
ncbi:MAG: hypothetical protein LC798_21240 [Chloroflexi bacterium]|nr:hypothetical protein [Chloroflexota bacterium]